MAGDTQNGSRAGSAPNQVSCASLLTDEGRRAVFKLYEDGKHRRYAMLFAVNGGAAALAEFLSNDTERFLTGINLTGMGIGMIVFNATMYFDIMWFGLRMRKAAGFREQPRCEGIFSLWGRLVLTVIALLLAAAWSAAASLVNLFVLIVLLAAAWATARFLC